MNRCRRHFLVDGGVWLQLKIFVNKRRNPRRGAPGPQQSAATVHRKYVTNQPGLWYTLFSFSLSPSDPLPDPPVGLIIRAGIIII